MDPFRPSTSFRRLVFGTPASRKGSAFYGYSLSIIAMGAGWLFREADLISAASGVGYWLGITGGSMMLLLLVYPLRKRILALRFLGAIPQWFRLHMMLGILGPLLVLFHANFQFGSFNSQVALVCMLLVAGSGVVGRHIYAHIHKGLYGEKTSLRNLQLDLTQSLGQSQGLATLMPEFTANLEKVSTEVLGDAITGSLGTSSSLLWTVRRYRVWWTLRKTAMRELSASAASSATIARDYPRLKNSTTTYIRRFVRLTGRVAQFTLYERLFAYWHVLHLPLFLMMVISALVHVLAVHMY
jgi:hypothetical protein